LGAGGLIGIILIAGTALVPTGVRVRAVIAGALVLFVLPILIFTNLHVVHDYYQTSCTLFLIASLALAVAVWVPSLVRHPAAVPPSPCCW
jgi:hypothetical protein